MKNKIINLFAKIYPFWPFIIIALSGLLIIFQYKTGTLFYYWDQYFPLNINEALKNYTYVWHNESGFGNYDTGSLNLLVYISFIKLISFFSSDICTIQKILYYIIFCFSGLSFYYLLNVTFRNNKNKILVFAAIFYSLNIFSLVYIWRMNLSSIFLYAFLPLAFGAYVDLLNKPNSKNILLLSIGFVLMIPAFGHPAYLITAWFLFSTYSIFKAIISRSLRPVIRFFKLVFLWIIFNLWWLYPMLLNSGTTLELSGNNSSDNAIMIYYTTSKYSIWQNVIRLLGEWHLYDYHFGIKDFSWLSNYTSNSIHAILLYIIPLVAVVVMFLRKRYDDLHKEKIYFILLFIVSAIFIIGPNINKSLFVWVFENNIFFRMFRNSYEKAGILLSISSSFLVAYIVFTILKSSINTKLKNGFVLIFFIILLVIIPFPFYKNKIYPTGNNYLPSSLVTIPDQYRQIGDLLKNNEKTFIFPFQNSPLQSAKNNTKSYLGIDMLKNLTMSSIISTETGIPNNDQIAKDISFNLEHSGDKDYINKLFEFFQVRYLINDPNIMDLSMIGDGIYDQFNRQISAEIPIKNKISNINVYEFEKNNKNEVFVAKHPIYLPSDQTSNIFNLLKYVDTDNIYLTNKTNNDLKNLPNSMVLDINDAKLEENKLIFDLNDFKEGEYNIKLALYDKLQSKNDKINNLLINDIVAEIVTNQNEKILDAGNYNFDSESKIELKTTLSNINITNGNFEKGLWQCIDTTPASPGNPEFNCSQNTDSKQGYYSAELSSKNHRLGMRQKIKLDKDKTYELSFNYKYISGAKPYFVIEYLDPKNEYPIAEKKYYLNGSKSWEDYGINFQPKTGEIYLYFYSDPTWEQSKILFDNVNIKEINTGLIKNIIINSNNSKNINYGQTPEITFNKINPTKYVINVKNATTPYLLNLLQTYNKNWILFDDKGKLLVNNDKHYLSDGYANSWLISKTGSYKIIIEFDTQKKVRQIVYFTIILIVLTIFGLIILNFKNRKNKLKIFHYEEV